MWVLHVVGAAKQHVVGAAWRCTKQRIACQQASAVACTGADASTAAAAVIAAAFGYLDCRLAQAVAAVKCG